MDRLLNQYLLVGVNGFGAAVLERVRALPIERNIVYHQLECPPARPVAEAYLDFRKRLLDVLNREVYNFANTPLTVYLVGPLVEEHMAANLMHLGYLFKTFFRENIILNPRVKLLTALPTIIPEVAWLPATRKTLERIDGYAALKEQFQPAYPGVKRALPAISGPPFEEVVFCYSESLDPEDVEVSAQAAATKVYFDLVILPKRLTDNPELGQLYRGFPAGQPYAPISGTAVAFLPSLAKLVRDEMEYVLMIRLCDRFFAAGPAEPGKVERLVEEVLTKVRCLRLPQLVEDIVRHALDNERWFDLASIDALAKYDIEISAPPDTYLQRFLDSLGHERNRFAGRVRDLALEASLALPERIKDCLTVDFPALSLGEVASLFTQAFFRASQILDQRGSLASQLKNDWQRARSDVESKVARLKQIAGDKSARLKRGSETEARVLEVFRTISVRDLLKQAIALSAVEGLAGEGALESRMRAGYDRIHGLFTDFLKKRDELMTHLHNRRDAYLRNRELYLYVFNQIFRQRLLDAELGSKMAEMETAEPADALARVMSTYFFREWFPRPELPLEDAERGLMEAIRLKAGGAVAKIATEMRVDYGQVIRILREIADAQVNSIFDMKYKEHPQAAYRQAMFLCHREELPPGERSIDGPDVFDVAHLPELPFQVLQVMELYNLPFRALRQYASLDRQEQAPPEAAAPGA
jgi:hypothetical protein